MPELLVENTRNTEGRHPNASKARFVLAQKSGQRSVQKQTGRSLVRSGANPGSHLCVLLRQWRFARASEKCLFRGFALLKSSGCASETETDRQARLFSGTRFAAALDDGASITRRCGMDVHRLVAAEPCPSRTGSRVLSALTRCVQRPNRLVVAALFAQQRRSRSPRSHIWGRSSGVV